MSVGPLYIIRRLIKGGGHSTIFNAYKGYKPKRLISGGLSP
jgi:hypothetical protein